MTRLTKHIREQILANAQTKSGNRAARDATSQKRKSWDEAVRLDSLKGHAELLLSWMQKWKKFASKSRRVSKATAAQFSDADKSVLTALVLLYMPMAGTVKRSPPHPTLSPLIIPSLSNSMIFAQRKRQTMIAGIK